MFTTDLAVFVYYTISGQHFTRHKIQFQDCGRSHLVPATTRCLKSTPFSEEKNKLREVKGCDQGHTDNMCHATLEPRPAILASVLLTTLSFQAYVSFRGEKGVHLIH